MTWNIRGMRGSDGRVDPERVARVLDELKPDVVGLQEVGALRGATRLEKQAQTVANLTGLEVAFGPTVDGEAFCYGNCILVRGAIEATRSYDLSVPGREPRGCIRADVKLPNTTSAPAPPILLHVFNVHLGLHWLERRRQASQLLSSDILRDVALAYPLVLAGDFNAWTNRAAVPRWLRNQLTDCAVASHAEGPTFPALFPLLRLDRVYVDVAWNVLSCRVVDSKSTRGASDHLPVVAEIELNESARAPPSTRPLAAQGVATVIR